MAIRKPGFNSDNAEPMTGSKVFSVLTTAYLYLRCPQSCAGLRGSLSLRLRAKAKMGFAKMGRRNRVYTLRLGYREGGLGSQKFDYCSVMAFQWVPAMLMCNWLPLQFLTPRQGHLGTRQEQYRSWYGPISIRKHLHAPFAAGAAGGRCLLADKLS